MNTINAISYPQVQAIEPTENMQWQKERKTALRVYGGLIMVIGGGMAAYSDINHISDTMTIVGAVMFFVGAIAMSINTHSCQYLTKEQREYNQYHLRSHKDESGSITGSGMLDKQLGLKSLASFKY